ERIRSAGMVKGGQFGGQFLAGLVIEIGFAELCRGNAGSFLSPLLDQSPRLTIALGPVGGHCEVGRFEQMLLAVPVPGQQVAQGHARHQRPPNDENKVGCPQVVNAETRPGDRVKLLYWVGDGLAIWYRRLEEGTFVFPKLAEGSGLSWSRAVGTQGLEIRSTDLAMLLDGVDLASVKRQKRYQRPAATADQTANETP